MGLSVVLLEKGRHRRFAIGESSTPLANLLLEDIARRYDLPRLAPLSKWGSWQRTYPEIAAGLKRGFSFYRHEFGKPYSPGADRRNQLLVAASPNDRIGDTHWYRADVDHFLYQEALRIGVTCLDEIQLDPPRFNSAAVELCGTRKGESVSLQVRYCFDATGPAGYLSTALGLPMSPFRRMPPTQALYTHFKGVSRLEHEAAGVTQTPPYPIEDAAVHHLFDGGWIWVLHLNNGRTSAGAVLVDALAKELRVSEGADAWNRLLLRLPTLAGPFANACPVEPFRHAPRLSFRYAQVVGDRWALLPSAAGFVDPLLSTGFPLALLGIRRVAEALQTGLETFDFRSRMEDYGRQTLSELDTVERLVASLYASFKNGHRFARLSLLYFAAVSHAETRLRLHPDTYPGDFLMQDHPLFGPASRACFDAAMDPSARDSEFLAQIADALAHIDICGWGDLRKRNWHSVTTGDLVASARLLGASQEGAQEMVSRMEI
jgi:FADH2 O2-dependent halogenase